MDSKKRITGMEIRNVAVDDVREYAKFYVSLDDIKYSNIPLEDETNDTQFFLAACQWLEDYNEDVLNTDEAKIDTFWTEKS